MPNATSRHLADETRKLMAPEPFRILRTRTVAERLGCSPQACYNYGFKMKSEAGPIETFRDNDKTLHFRFKLLEDYSLLPDQLEAKYPFEGRA